MCDTKHEIDKILIEYLAEQYQHEAAQARDEIVFGEPNRGTPSHIAITQSRQRLAELEAQSQERSNFPRSFTYL